MTPFTDPMAQALEQAFDRLHAENDTLRAELARLHTALNNQLLAACDMAYTMAGMQAEIDRLREALENMIENVPVDVVRIKVGYWHLSQEEVNETLDTARALLAELDA